MFPINHWYVAAFDWELQERPLGRTLLGQPLVLFRTSDGRVAALEDRCCHRSLPLSCGTVEASGLRCGYHGMLYDTSGRVIEIPGQTNIPSKAYVRSWHVRVRDHIVWLWHGAAGQGEPDRDPPSYPHHDSGQYSFKGDVYRYEAPYQLIHDNLLDLSHLGYVHVKTIGGNPTLHMSAPTQVSGDEDVVRVVRHMPNSPPPPTYAAAWPFRGDIDRWQEIEFHVSYLSIWTGAIDAGSGSLDDPERGGFHMRGFHGITPETETSSHYFWTIASNRHPEGPDNLLTVFDQTAATFEEDRLVVNAQWANVQRFGGALTQVGMVVDAGANRARRIVARLAGA